MKRILFLFALLILLGAQNLIAAKADSCLFVQLDLANRWIWRGVAYSEAPVIQPSLGFESDKLFVSLWGSYPFERRAYGEVDLILEYQLFPQLKIGFTDYFAVNDSMGARHEFFDMKRETTSHMFDAYFQYQPFEKIPVSLLYSVWFWGADRDEETLKQNMSSYLELKFEKEYELFTASAFAGFTPSKGFYASKAALVNLGVGIEKPITLGGIITIPAKVELVINPETQNVYINAIITLN